MLGNVAIVFLVVATVFGQDEVYFSKTPSNIDVIQGLSVQLPCEVTPSDGVTYYWELNGSKVVNTTRRYQVGADLRITRVDRERDSGQFTCIAQINRGTSITSSSASLNIQWIDEVSVQLQEPELPSLITTGNDVVLRCHTDASGDVRFEWFRNADRLTKSNKLDIKKRKLHIKGVQTSDNGVYRCIASNEAGKRKSTSNFAITVIDGSTAQIKVVPKDHIVAEGGTAYFFCQYQADVTEWYFKETGPLENNTKTIIHSNGTLQINNVQKQDTGLYNCVGISSESAEVPQSYTAELELAYLHPLTNATSFEPPELEPENVKIIAEGATFQLTCLAPDSLPPAKKWWTYPSGHTISDSGSIRVDDDGRLIIDKTELKNAGRYTCTAENIVGKTEISVNIIVTTKPEIVLHPKSVTVEEGEPTILNCHYKTSSPSEHTSIKWRKDGKALNINSANRRIKILQANNSLVIQSTQILDRGEYICEVSTKGFTPIHSQVATISVIELLKFTPAPVNKKIELGSVAKVHCKVQGTPSPSIRWEKQDGDLASDAFGSHISDLNGTLLFNGVQSDDRGRYNCIATNSQGTINATIQIDVVVAPKFTILPKSPTEVNEGDSVMIDCVVEGDPKPTIQWDKNLKMNDFDIARFTVLENGTLLITNVRREDENKYGCTAGSSAGLNRKEVQLIVHSEFNTDSDSTVTKAVLITMSVAGAYIILVVGLMVWCRLRRRSRKLPVTDVSKVENGDIDHTELKDTANGTAKPPTAQNGLDHGQKSDSAETTHSQSSSHSKKSKTSYDKLSLSRTHIHDIKLIGRGEFGDVTVGKCQRSALLKSDSEQTDGETDQTVTVLVKALSQTKDENSLAEFKREIDIFRSTKHENVISLFGLCRESEPHWMIMEHTDWGDLKQFLVATQKGTTLTQVQNVGILHQLARGMDYLSNLRLVHRDLAARNCLVTSKLCAKIGLPRLTRDPYAQEYCKHQNQIIPLRWLPFEAVYEDDYSAKSDVYSFGVVIGEVYRQGELPFPKWNDNSFLSKLRDHKIEWKAVAEAPEDLQSLQIKCLERDPSKRPVFSDLVKNIQEILKSL